MEEAISDIVNGVGEDSEKNGDKVGDTEVDPAPAQDPEEEYEDELEPEPLDGEEDDDPSVPISESKMQEWVDALNRFTPKK